MFWHPQVEAYYDYRGLFHSPSLAPDDKDRLISSERIQNICKSMDLSEHMLCSRCLLGLSRTLTRLFLASLRGSFLSSIPLSLPVFVSLPTEHKDIYTRQYLYYGFFILLSTGQSMNMLKRTTLAVRLQEVQFNKELPQMEKKEKHREGCAEAKRVTEQVQYVRLFDEQVVVI